VNMVVRYSDGDVKVIPEPKPEVPVALAALLEEAL
jgi:hypothetical protein